MSWLIVGYLLLKTPTSSKIQFWSKFKRNLDPCTYIQENKRTSRISIFNMVPPNCLCLLESISKRFTKKNRINYTFSFHTPENPKNLIQLSIFAHLKILRVSFQDIESYLTPLCPSNSHTHSLLGSHSVDAHEACIIEITKARVLIGVVRCYLN